MAYVSRLRNAGICEQNDGTGRLANAAGAASPLFVGANMHPSALEVQSYYDSFLKHRMLDYRISGNLRIEKAKKFFVSHLRKTT
jgi:hypothetical protein